MPAEGRVSFYPTPAGLLGINERDTDAKRVPMDVKPGRGSRVGVGASRTWTGGHLECQRSNAQLLPRVIVFSSSLKSGARGQRLARGGGSLSICSRSACSRSAGLSGLFTDQSMPFKGQLLIPDRFLHGRDGRRLWGSRLTQSSVNYISPVATRPHTGRHPPEKITSSSASPLPVIL